MTDFYDNVREGGHLPDGLDFDDLAELAKLVPEGMPLDANLLELAALVKAVGADYFTKLAEDIETARALTAHRRTFKADDRLSRAVTAFSRANGYLRDALEDVDRFGAPQECAALVQQRYDEKLREALKDLGYTLSTYILELESRVDARQAYSKGWLPDSFADLEWYEYDHLRALLDGRLVVWDLSVVDWETGEVVVDAGAKTTLDQALVVRERLELLADCQDDDSPRSVSGAARARYALRQIDRAARRPIWIGTREVVR